jgi:hypothetical protein
VTVTGAGASGAGTMATAAGTGAAPPDGPAAPPVRVETPIGLQLLFAGLVLYAAFGKGFAYAGWPPVFVGEVLLAVVLASAVRPYAAIPRNPAALVTVGLAAIAVVQLGLDLVDASTPVLETIRGLAPIYYSLFAFGAYALLRWWESQVGWGGLMDRLEQAIVRVTPFVTVVVLVLAALLLVQPTGLPTWPGSAVPLLLTKPGDIAVTLVLLSPVLLPRRLSGRVIGGRWPLIAMWCVTALLVTFRSRGALLALVAGLVVARPSLVRLTRVALAMAAVVLVLYATGLRIEVQRREVSFQAAGDAVGSLVGTEPEDEIAGNYVGTRNWRTQWWEDIWADATSERMVLHGHGWGDNLAVRYGIVSSDAAGDPRVLRLPHSIAFSLIGRAGVLLALGFLAVPALTVVRSFRHRDGPADRPVVHGARGAIVAAVVTGLFGVFIESPQGGILFWSLIGFVWWATADRGTSRDRVV